MPNSVFSLTQKMSQEEYLKAMKESNEKHVEYAREFLVMHCKQANEEVRRVIDKRLPEMRWMEKELQPSVSYYYILRTALYSEAKEKNRDWGEGNEDPRLDSFHDYLVANNVGKDLMEAAIAEQLAIANTEDQHEYVQGYAEIKKTSLKFVKNVDPELAKDLRNWHRCYESFRTANGIFMMGVDFMLHFDYASALSCYMKVCMMNRTLGALEPITIHEKYKKMDRLGFFVDICIEHCNEILIKRFEAGELGISVLVKTVLIPAMQFLKGHGGFSKNLKAVKNRWKRIESSCKIKWMDIVDAAFNGILMYGDQNVPNLSRLRLECFQSATGSLGLNRFSKGYMEIVGEWDSTFNIGHLVSGNFDLNFNKKLADDEKLKANTILKTEEDVIVKVAEENLGKLNIAEKSLKPSKKDRKRMKKQQQREQKCEAMKIDEEKETSAINVSCCENAKQVEKVSRKVSIMYDDDEFKEMADGVIEKAERELEIKISEVQILKGNQKKMEIELLEKRKELAEEKRSIGEAEVVTSAEIHKSSSTIIKLGAKKDECKREIDEMSSLIHELEQKRSSMVIAHKSMDKELKECEIERNNLQEFLEAENEKSKSTLSRLKTTLDSLEANIGQLEKNILNIELGKAEETSSIVPKADPNSKIIQFLDSSIQSKEKQLECPVCFCVSKSPIFSCFESHLVCGNCRTKLKLCPECRLVYKDHRRHRYAEMIATELETLLKQREELM